MDVRLSTEQQALRDSVTQMVERLGPTAVGRLDDRERIAKLDAAVDASGWRELRAADDHGAPWATGVDVAIVAEGLARGAADVAFVGPTLAADLRRAIGADPAVARETIALRHDLGALGADVAVDAAGAAEALAAREDAVVARKVEPPRADVDLTRPSGALRDDGTVVGALAVDELTRWNALGLALTCADLVGTMQGAVDVSCDYAKERRQYGVAIGSFQAVQHLLADALVLTEGSRSITLHAAWAADALPPDEALAAAASAKAYYGRRAARTVCETAIQVHGGIGNTWEHMAHVFLRRALLSTEMFGGVGPSLERILAHHEMRGVMDFADAPEEAEFRQRLRAWVAENDPGLPPSSTDDAYWAGQAAWHQSLYDAGFFGLSWTVAVGGQGLPSVYDAIVDEELAAAGAPPRPGLGYLVHGILEHGDDDIQRRFLPGLVSGRERWCQGFSEPDAGSDLASLRTRADRDGDDYLITGHKVWTSYSDDADWCIVLARTDHEVAKHKGISAFAIAMDQPGIEQRPLKMINGITKEFGEVLFDDARVPAANMVGAPGEGWALAMTIVSHEREPGELGYVARYRKLVKELTARVRDDPARFGDERRRDLAWAIVEADMLRHHVARRLSDRLDGITHGPEGSVDKLLMTWTEQSVGHAALSVGGTTPGSDPTWLAVYLYSRAQSVMGGTSQIQRNLVARRILGLSAS